MGMAEALRDAAPERERRTLPKLQDIARKIRDWEAGKWGVSERYQLLYCRATGKTEEDLFGPYLKARKATTQTAGTQAAWEKDEDDVERRRLLAALATLGVATVSPVADALQTIRGSVENSLHRDISLQMDEWDEKVAEYGYAYLSTSLDVLIGDLAADLVDLQSLKLRLPSADPQRSRWYRVNAGLSWLMAKSLGNTGQTRDARAWWMTAQHAADASGDVDLGLWIAGERLIRGLYERRPAAILLRQAATVFERSGGRPCAGLASVHNVRAQLLAMEGRGNEAISELRNAEEVFAQLPSSVTQDIGSTMSYGEDRIRFTAAWVHAHLGQRGPLDDATDRALAVLGNADPRSTTQVKLLQAAGHVQAGDVMAGVNHAMEIYERCPAEHRTVIMGRLAGGVWEAVPVERRKDPAIAPYRELLSTPGRKAIM
ncbi:hypothetical protein GCM10023195_77440 [Actinoallomurus liliacearum]|uniref:XRE family transcriptional regulator n=2 Tax=Actinoallomurus liliacearum TaxID=1080073 RepID=A0ABP8TV85_9ACTN